MKTDVKILVDKLLLSLNRGDQGECQPILDELSSYPTGKHWSRYGRAVLAYMDDSNIDSLVQTLEHLQEEDYEPFFHSKLLTALSRMALVQGRWAEVIAYNQEALSYVNHDPIETIRILRNSAEAYRNGYNQGDLGTDALELGLQLCKDAQALMHSNPNHASQDSHLESLLWTSMGALNMNLGQLEESLRCYHADLEICTNSNDRLGMGGTYLNIGEIYVLQTDYEKALQMYQQALGLFRTMPDEKARLADVLANLGHLTHNLGQLGQAFSYYEESIAIYELLRTRSQSDAARIGFFSTISEVYANMVWLCIDAEKPDAAFNFVERSQARAFLDILDKDSQQVEPNYETQPLTLTQVQQSLSEDSILLEYYTSGLIEYHPENLSQNATAHRHRFPPEKIWLFAITHDDVQIIDTGLSPNELIQQRSGSVARRNFLRRKFRRVLYQKLILPAIEEIRGKSRVYIAPHGPIHYLPFQSFISSEGTTLLEELNAEIIHAPSASVLFAKMEWQRDKDGSVGTPCLTVGYNGMGDYELIFSEGEARNIAQCTNGHVLDGDGSKLEPLAELAPRYGCLHFACHGTFNPESPLDSYLWIGAHEKLSAKDILDKLHLRCDLVVLSACQSGMNKVRRGDELIGLTRAFLHAGTRALVATLWRVNEPSTRIFMEKFYGELALGHNPAKALAHSQAYLKNLTYDEALIWLVGFLKEDLPDFDLDTLTERAAQIIEEMNTEQAQELNQRHSRDADASSVGENKIFSQPYYWAPFVIISTDVINT